jgi:hypothetical protein
MMRSVLLISVTLGLVAGAYESVRTETLMVDAAKTYLASLNPEQRKKTVFALDNMDERTHWLYTPNERHGLQFREMTSDQRHLAEALLSAGVSQQGLVKVHTIMSLDSILRIYEKNQGPERDPDKYFVSIFGEPSVQGRWGYRVEGHHVSLNFTVIGGRIASTPSFFGSNPADVPDGPMKGLRALGREEDLGRELVQSLSQTQRATAIVEKIAPADILTTNSRKAALKGQGTGLPFADMTLPQKEILQRLVAEYAADFPTEIAEKRLEQFRRTQPTLFFAWAGGINQGEKHYYRIQTSEFLIEYDKTQDNGNHIHSVWRDFNDDWGEDLLAAHYQASH